MGEQSDDTGRTIHTPSRFVVRITNEATNRPNAFDKKKTFGWKMKNDWGRSMFPGALGFFHPIDYSWTPTDSGCGSGSGGGVCGDGDGVILFEFHAVDLCHRNIWFWLFCNQFHFHLRVVLGFFFRSVVVIVVLSITRPLTLHNLFDEYELSECTERRCRPACSLYTCILCAPINQRNTIK